MSATKGTKRAYRDLLWDFSTGRYSLRSERALQKGYDRAESQDTVRLRVFAGTAGEQALFDADQTEAQAFDIPLDALAGGSEAAPLQKGGPETAPLPPDPSLLYEAGRRLWEAIPPEVRQPLLEAGTTRPCRLKISGSSPAIADLPWEWLNDGTGLPFALRPEIRLARSVPVPVASPPITYESPLRVLLVLTNPRDERLLDPWREIDAIRPALSTGYYDLKILEEPTWDAFVQAVSPGGEASVPYGREPHIVHYIGHAGVVRGEGNVILHDSLRSQDVTHWISGPELAQALPLTVRLLCLSTCFTVPNYQILGLSRLAHTAALHRLPTTVANRYPVDEGGVRVFWDTFYTALARNRGNVNEAFSRAQQSAALHVAGANWGSFSLVIRDQSGKMMRAATRQPAAIAKHPDQRERKGQRGLRPSERESLYAGGAAPAVPLTGDELEDLVDDLEDLGDEEELDPRALELQAQLSSQLANQLAAQMRGYGANAPREGSMSKQYREEAARASSLIEQLRKKPEG